MILEIKLGLWFLIISLLAFSCKTNKPDYRPAFDEKLNTLTNEQVEAASILSRSEVNIKCYTNAIKFISKDIEISKGFLFLTGRNKLNKRYFSNGIYKLKVNDYLYAPNLNIPNYPCLDTVKIDKQLKNEELRTGKLASHDEGYKFVVFFSRKIGNYFECKIVSSSNPEIDNDYFARTRFGKVMILNFCTSGDQIVNYKMTLVQAN